MLAFDLSSSLVPAKIVKMMMFPFRWLQILFIVHIMHCSSDTWGPVWQKRVSRAGTSNYITKILWDVITGPFPWYLLLAHTSSTEPKWTWGSHYTYIYVQKRNIPHSAIILWKTKSTLRAQTCQVQHILKIWWKFFWSLNAKSPKCFRLLLVKYPAYPQSLLNIHSSFFRNVANRLPAALLEERETI